MAAISSVLPLGVAREAFAQGGAPEKKDLKIGFIPITCATPIIMAHPMGFYAKQGLNVEVVKTAGWKLESHDPWNSTSRWPANFSKQTIPPSASRKGCISLWVTYTEYCFSWRTRNLEA